MEKTPERVELTPSQMESLLAEIELSNLSPRSKEIITKVLRAMVWLEVAVSRKKLTIKKLLRIFVGRKTESQENLFRGRKGSDHGAPGGGAGADRKTGTEHDDDDDSRGSPGSGPGLTSNQSPANAEAQPEKKGHGKNGAASFSGLEVILCPHGKLKIGDLCPECGKAKLYACDPGHVLHVVGQAPFHPELYESENLRCPSCQAYFSAELPEGVSPSERFDASANALVGVFKYGSGLPFYRNEKLQSSLGVPLPASTQWDMVQKPAAAGLPVYRQLIVSGAQGEVLHHDDTKVKILSLMAENKTLPKGERRGMQTTGIVCKLGDHEVDLFISGRKHAGENLGSLLGHRARELTPPIQVSDALAANFAHDFKTIIVKCLDHARREVIDVEEELSSEAAHIIRELGKVYHHDAIAKQRKMSAKERLDFHRENSGPVMGCLKEWMATLLALRRVEPNSKLGDALRYFLDHWEGLTQFLHVSGAPLSNAAVERLLKTAILHRKNSLFYRTEVGAWVGDVLMSLIQTAIKAKANPFDYLTQLQRFKTAVRKNPLAWMPWNYSAAVATAAA